MKENELEQAFEDYWFNHLGYLKDIDRLSEAGIATKGSSIYRYHLRPFKAGVDWAISDNRYANRFAYEKIEKQAKIIELLKESNEIFCHVKYVVTFDDVMMNSNGKLARSIAEKAKEIENE